MGKVIALLLPLLLTGQTNDATKYEVASFVINKTLSHLPLDYFLTEPFNPKVDWTGTNDTLTLFDPETYEETTWSRWEYDSLYLPKKMAEYEAEMVLWRQAQLLGKKVVVLQNMPQRRTKELSDYGLASFVEFKDLLPMLRTADSTIWDISKISNQTDVLLVNTDEVVSKYSITGYFMLDVALNEQKDIALVHFGTHYMISRQTKGSGRSGYGVLYCLAKQGTGWRFVKSITLWEE